MPPVELKEYTWSQSKEALTIQVPLTAASSHNIIGCSEIDFVTLENYVKVNAPPYLFELFLTEEIDESTSKCMLLSGKLIFELNKKITKQWDAIEKNLSGKEKVEQRIKMVEKLQTKNQAMITNKCAARHQHKENAIKDQMQLESDRNSCVESTKSIEREEFSKHMVDLEQIHKIQEIRPPKSSNSGEHFPIPLIRRQGKISVNFSAREFPTPSRESTLEDERHFLNKQLAARKAAGFVCDDLRPEECNPVWLKSKGDSFFKCMNYLGAISAYSHAIKMGASMPELYSNRSACHLQIGNLHKALEDVSKAIELLTPVVPSTRNIRAKCYARRGIILCKLGLAEKASSEFEEAIKLRPDDQQLRNDYEACKAMIREESAE